MKLIKLFLLLTLVSCTSFETNNIAPGYIATFNSLKNLLVGYDSDLINSELINNIPYASLTLKIGRGPKGLLILESVRNENYYWLSADSIYLVIRDGRIIKTQGLENDLREVIYPRTSFKEIMTIGPKQFKAFYSFTNPELNNLELQFSYLVGEKENIQILDNSMNLILVTEEISNRVLGWKLSNKYWVDENYYVWKSEQALTPKIPPFNVEITKKPSM